MAEKKAQTFRANVGIVVVNDRGEALALERWPKGSGRWQMPQGGIDEGEEPGEAWRRELHEETGLGEADFEFLGEHPDWLVYELPPDKRSPRVGRGQAQKWYFVRIRPGAEIRFDPEPGYYAPEFADAKWMPLDALAESTWEVRRPTYRKLAARLRELLAST